MGTTSPENTGELRFFNATKLSNSGIVTMKAPKPVLFNLCWISLGYGFLATGFILPWPIPMPAELWGLMPVAVGVIVHRAVMHYHRFL